MKDDVIHISREIMKSVGKRKIVELSKVNPLKSVWHFLSEWIMIIGMIMLSEMYWHPLLYIIAVIFIGARMQAFVALTHDGAHYHFFKNKKLNDWVTMLFATWPILASLFRYRNDHFPHHNFLNSRKDPDYVIFSINEDFDFPQSRKKLIWIFIKDLTGYTAINEILTNLKKLFYQIRYRNNKMFKNNAAQFHPLYILGKTFYYIAIFGLIAYFFGWKIIVLYWLIPFATWFQFIFRLRTIAEHYALPNKEVLIGTRNVLPNFLEKIFLVPKSLNYHLDHHLFPGVPLHNLSKLHKVLLGDDMYKKRAHNLSSYFLVIKEVLGKNSRSEAAAV